MQLKLNFKLNLKIKINFYHYHNISNVFKLFTKKFIYKI